MDNALLVSAGIALLGALLSLLYLPRSNAFLNTEQPTVGKELAVAAVR
jgi:hypothetical protein